MSFVLANNLDPGIICQVNIKGQDQDVLLSVYGVMHVIINSRKERGKELKEFILNDIIPRGLNEKTKQLQEDHQLATTD